LARGFLIHEINLPRPEISLVEGNFGGEEKIYALYEVIRRQEYSKKPKRDRQKIRHVKINPEEDHE